MSKSIIKEIIIVLLLCLAIILVLSVLLYGYVPSNKIVPETVSYVTPQDAKEELAKADTVDSSQVILTYSVDSTDLNNYETVSQYVAGKPNPFSSYENEEAQENGNTTTTTNGGTATSTQGSSGTSGNEQSTGITSTTTEENTSAYFQDKGTK